MKLALGTAQFGFPYGVANTLGQVDQVSAEKILMRARKEGIDTLDTAMDYGESEKCLGQADVGEWRIITKLSGIPEFCEDISGWVNSQVDDSLSRLGLKTLNGLLLHRPYELLGSNGEKLWAAVESLKKDGVVEKIGFSIYDFSELDRLWFSFQPDLVQVPYNILDCRLVTSGWLSRMNDARVEVHVRSIFLQGLLLMSRNERPKKFDRWSNLWHSWDKWLYEEGLTAQEACVSFAMADKRISRVVVGVDSLVQLEEILSLTDRGIIKYPKFFNVGDLINPSRWNLL